MNKTNQNSRLFRILVAIILQTLLVCHVYADYTSTLSGDTVTMNGEADSHLLVIKQVGGLMKHNRKTQGDAGYNSDFDFDTSLEGDQVVTTGPGTVINVQGGGASSDALQIDDTQNALNTNYTLTTDTLQGRYTLNYSGIHSLNVSTGSGSQFDKVLSTSAGVAYYFTVGRETGIVRVGSAAHLLDEIQGSLSIDSKGSVHLDDTGQVSGLTYSIDTDIIIDPPFSTGKTVFTRPGVAALRIASNSTSVETGSGNDNILVHGTEGRVEIEGGGGNDTCTVSDGSHSLGSVFGVVAFNGEAGTNSLVVDDSGSSTPTDYAFDQNEILVNSFDQDTFFVNPSVDVTLQNVADVAILAGSSHNIASMQLPGVAVTPAVHWDLGQLGQGNLLQVNGQATTEVLNLDGRANTLAGSIPWGDFGPITWSHVDQLMVNGLQGSDEFTVFPSAETEIFLHGDEPNSAPGDSLTLLSDGQASTLDNGTYLLDGYQPVRFNGFESVEGPAPDLAADLAGIMAPVATKCKTSSKGTRCSLKGTLYQLNSGELATTTSSVTKFYISDDAMLDSSDLVVSTVFVKPLLAGGIKKIALKAKLPDGFNSSGKFLIVSIDDEHAIAEKRESNNLLVTGPLP